MLKTAKKLHTFRSRENSWICILFCKQRVKKSTATKSSILISIYYEWKRKTSYWFLVNLFEWARYPWTRLPYAVCTTTLFKKKLFCLSWKRLWVMQTEKFACTQWSDYLTQLDFNFVSQARALIRYFYMHAPSISIFLWSIFYVFVHSVFSKTLSIIATNTFCHVKFKT